MNENKEIEQIARAMCECYLPTLGICKIDKKPCDCCCADYGLAKKIYNVGFLYVKDKVVLSKEGYDILIAVENARINEAKEQARKETIKEIIDKIDDMIGGKMIAQALREIYLEKE